MRRSIKIILVVAIFAFVNSNSYAKEDLDFSFETLGGENYDLKSMHGKVVIVNLWAWWCPNCHKEMDILNDLYAKYNNKGLEIVGISIDKKDDLKKVLEVSKRVSYPSSTIDKVQHYNLPKVQSVPATYVFDRNGELQHVNVFMQKDWERVLSQLL